MPAFDLTARLCGLIVGKRAFTFGRRVNARRLLAPCCSLQVACIRPCPEQIGLGSVPHGL